MTWYTFAEYLHRCGLAVVAATSVAGIAWLATLAWRAGRRAPR